MISEVWEALLIFLLVGAILGASPLEIAMCIVARVTFALLFTAGNVLVERVFGMVSSKTLIFLFYFLALALMTVPGIVVGVILSILASRLGDGDGFGRDVRCQCGDCRGGSVALPESPPIRRTQQPVIFPWIFCLTRK